jgi:hypothetical protein
VGWATVWAGRDTPISELERLASQGWVAVLAISASVRADPRALAEASERLGAASRAGRVGLVLGGRGSWPDPPPFGAVVRSFTALRRWMARFDRGHL